MMDERKLKNMRDSWDASGVDVHYFSRADFDVLADTIDALLKIARAAQDFMDAKMNANDAAVDQAQQNLYEALSALPPVEDKGPEK